MLLQPPRESPGARPLLPVPQAAGKHLEAYKLEVFVPSEVAVSEGGDAILPCRSVTAGQSVKSARWRRNGEVLLELNGRTGEITYGNHFNRSRVSIPSDWDRRADLSLTIKGAQQQDGGVYYLRKPPVSAPHHLSDFLGVNNFTILCQGDSAVTTVITTTLISVLAAKTHSSGFNYVIQEFNKITAVTSVIVFTLKFFWGWREKTKGVHEESTSLKIALPSLLMLYCL
uniref:Ig-like domain-containing protein n=1 Tax=Oreochromis aureus TaxID=47969 RepID=A0AAZ1XSB1_OREAU